MSIVLITFFLYNHFSKYRYFKILETTTYTMMQRTHHEGNFLACRIKLMMKRSAEQLTFNELWIEDRLYTIKVTDEENQPVENGFLEKQVLYIDVETEITADDRPLPSIESLKSKIFLGYQVGTKRKYISIENNIEELVPQLKVA